MTSRKVAAHPRMRVFALALATALLAACASEQPKPAQPPATTKTQPPQHPAKKPWKSLGPYTPGGLYAPGVSDGAPDVPPDIASLPEPVPHPEPLARYGNRSPYVVLGKSYSVLASAAGYDERGMASWYGTKFDGRVTSSLEPYDLTQFSAAHRTLPLPSYARVTNLENGRSVIVRINDRGPFHEGRLIDLSYAAAIKLGVNVHGTAMVEVRGIDTGQAASGAPGDGVAARPASTRAAMPAPNRTTTKPAPAKAAGASGIAATTTKSSDALASGAPASDAPGSDTTGGGADAGQDEITRPPVQSSAAPGAATDTAAAAQAGQVATNAADAFAANKADAVTASAQTATKSPASSQDRTATKSPAPSRDVASSSQLPAASTATPPVAASATPSPGQDPAPVPPSPPTASKAGMDSGSPAVMDAPASSQIGRPAVEPSTIGFLQVASYGDRGNAERMLERLQQAGIANAELVPVQVADQTLWRVHVGPMRADAADAEAARLQELGFGHSPFFKQ